MIVYKVKHVYELGEYYVSTVAK